MKIKIDVELNFEINDFYTTNIGLYKAQNKISNEILDSFQDAIRLALSKQMGISPEEVSVEGSGVRYNFIVDNPIN